MTKIESQNALMEMLRAEGFRPEVDRDGDLVFKHEGMTHVLLIDDHDPEFIQLVLPNFWKLEDALEKKAAVEACERTSAKTKVVKTYVTRDNVCASFEALGPIEAFRPILPRALRAIRAACRTFAERMTEAQVNAGRMATA